MEKASFHHVHLNVTNRDATLAYYQKYFGAKHIKYGNREDALLTEKSFLLVNEVGEQPPSHEGSSLWHIGWAGTDGPLEFEWRVKDGIEVHTPINPLGDDHWMYFFGPDNEVLEIFTKNKNHTFEHIHLLATDVDETMEWFKTYLGLVPDHDRAQPWPNGLFKWNVLHVDNINITVNGKPVEERTWFPAEFKPTKGTVFDHIAFSFKNIEMVYEHMKTAGQLIVEEIKMDPVYGFRNFFVRGPDGLLVEIVEENND